MEPEPKPAIVAGNLAVESAGESLALGRYVIFGHLGQGSQAETLKAVDKRAGTPVGRKPSRTLPKSTKQKVASGRRMTLPGLMSR